jgi:anti-sigma factor RsiW
MQCREVRELADSFLSEQLLVETNHELLRHLDGCPACRSEIETRRALRSTIQRAFTNAASLRLPDQFKRDAISRLRATTSSSVGHRVLGGWRRFAAAAVLLTAGLGLFLLSGRATAAERDAAGDHRDCALLMHLSEKPISLAEAAASYDSSFDRLQNTPADQVATPLGILRVVRRHSCAFDGRRFAHIILQFQGQFVSLLVAGDDHPVSRPLASPGSQPKLEWLPSVNGFNVVSFKTPGHVVFLVSSLPTAELSQAADAVAGPVYRSLVEEQP